MGLRTGAQYLEGISDDREVWLNGDRAEVTTHPQLAGYAHALAGNFDVQRDPALADLLTCLSPRTGETMSRAWHLPRSAEDLTKGREMFEFWERRCGGVLGRHPQYMASLIMGLYHLHPEVRRINPEWADNIVTYYDYCRENDLSVAFSASDPSRSRKLPGSAMEYLRVVEHRPEGVVIRGAKMIATQSAYADEVLCATIGRREVERRGNLYFAIPVATRGLKLVCRQSYSHAGDPEGPLSSRWDEMDSYLLFDDVLVPRDRIFLIEEEALTPWSIPATWGFHYGMMRVLVKAEAMIGICFAVADYMGTRKDPHVQALLGEAVAFAESLRAVVLDAERRPVFSSEGLAIPNPRQVALARVIDLQSHARLVEIVREICGTGLITSPNALDLDNPQIGPLVRRFIAGADEQAAERYRMMKLAWEYTCDSYAGRQLVFEEHNAVNLAGRRGLLLDEYDAQPAISLAKQLAGITQPTEVSA